MVVFARAGGVLKKRLVKFIRMMSEKKIDRHRLLFCINSGRCGSEYLAKLLGSAEEVVGFHEADPTMSGKYLRMINGYNYTKTIGKRRLKADAIKKILHEVPEGKIYCETNHMFIKTFFDVVMEMFKNVEIIILRRELALVLRSFIQLKYFTKENRAWPEWMSSPNAKTAAVPCIGSDEDMDQYDRCIAYLIDIEGRCERFKRKYPTVKAHEIRLEALNNYDNVSKLFEYLRITATDETREMIGKTVNVRRKWKRHFNHTVSLEYCRERIREYIGKIASMGIALPNSLAIDKYKVDDQDKAR